MLMHPAGDTKCEMVFLAPGWAWHGHVEEERFGGVDECYVATRVMRSLLRIGREMDG